MIEVLLRVFFSFLFLFVIGTGSHVNLQVPDAAGAKKQSQAVVEQPVTVIALDGAMAGPKAELSGLAWYGDNLILLPQFPKRFDNQLYFLPKAQIIDFLQGKSQTPLTPQPIPLVNADLLDQIDGYDGFEAIAFHGDQVFMTIEADTGQEMMGYLVTGSMTPDLSALTLDPQKLTKIPPQADLENIADEAVLLADDQVLTVYEVNSLFINSQPVAHRFAEADIRSQGTLPFPSLEYRVTDATPLDADNRFWVINYFFPGDIKIRNVNLGPDPLAVQYGIGPTHQQAQTVERLVEMQYTPTGITLAPTPPIQLQLQPDLARNWEGIARLDVDDLHGFLLATDTFPETLLAFVPSPQ